jgi:hypothetical protein
MKNNNLPLRRTVVRQCKDGITRGGFAKRTLDEDIAAFHAGVKKGAPDECWPWQGATLLMGNKSGGKYGTMTFMGKPMRTHRVAYMIAHNLRPIPRGKVIRHFICHFGLCCNPAHLKMGTHKQNMEDAKRDGSFATGDRSGSRTHPESRPRGENHPHAKITQKLVVECFRLRFEGLPEYEIAKKVGLSSVSAILNRTSWPHVKIPAEYLQIDTKKLHRANNGKAHRRFSDDDIRQARKLFDRGGITVTQIARKLGRSLTQTWKIVHRKVHADVAEPGTYQRNAPRVNILRGYWGNEPFSRTYSAPVTSGVTILSGQVISLSSGSWVLGCAAGLEPFIAFQDSVDTDVSSSGLLLGFSCAGQFEIETPWFDNTVTYAESAFLVAATGTSGTGNTSTSLVLPGVASVGAITLAGTSNADVIGYAAAGGRQDATSINSQSGFLEPVGSSASKIYLLRFRTQWFPHAEYAS